MYPQSTGQNPNVNADPFRWVHLASATGTPDSSGSNMRLAHICRMNTAFRFGARCNLVAVKRCAHFVLLAYALLLFVDQEPPFSRSSPPRLSQKWFEPLPGSAAFQPARVESVPLVPAWIRDPRRP